MARTDVTSGVVPPGGIAIGDVVTGGTDPAVLFIAGGLLSQAPNNFGYNVGQNLFFDNNTPHAQSWFDFDQVQTQVGYGVNTLFIDATTNGLSYDNEITTLNLNYSNLVGGPFTVGETVTGFISGSTAIIDSDNGFTLVVSSVSGPFQLGETIKGGTSLAEATLDSMTTNEFSSFIGVLDTGGTPSQNHYIYQGSGSGTVIHDNAQLSLEAIDLNGNTASTTYSTALIRSNAIDQAGNFMRQLMDGTTWRAFHPTNPDSLELTNNDTGYTPVGPLPFAGAYQTVGAIPTVSYSGLRSAGGLGQPVMELRNSITGAYSRALGTIGEFQIDAVIDPGSTNSTYARFSNGGSPVIIFTANSGSNSIIETFDPTIQSYSVTSTNGTTGGGILIETDGTPKTVLNSSDGVNADATLNLGGFAGTSDLSVTDGTNGISDVFISSTATATRSATDGTNSTTVTVNGDSTPAFTAQSTDGTGQALVRVAGDTVKQAQLIADDGAGGISDITVGTASINHATQAGVVTSTFNQQPTGFSMDKDLTVPDEAYSSSWDASLEVPTKNAIYDAIQGAIYSPAGSAPSNLDATPAPTGKWMRIGNFVFVSGTFSANPTAPGAASFEFALPIASNFDSFDDASGSISINGAIAPWEGGTILAEPTNNTFKVEWQATNVANQTYTYQVMYQII